MNYRLSQIDKRFMLMTKDIVDQTVGKKSK